MSSIRTATSEDADAVAHVIAEAFGIPEKADTHRAACEHAPSEWRVLEKADRIVSVCRVQVHRLRVGCCEITKGDVGMVATPPELQGRGLAGELMRDTVRHMRESGCQIGRLGGLSWFYSRFGWAPFPRRYYHFPLEPVKAGVKTLEPDEYLRPPKGFRGRIRPFDPVRDHEAHARLHRRFNCNRTGSIAVTFGDSPKRSEARPDETGLRVVCEVEGRTVAYVLGFERDREYTAFEALVEIGEVAYDFEHGEAFAALMAHVLREACRRGAKRVTGRLPFDSRVQDDLRDGGISYHLVELQTAPASNMIRIVDLLELLRLITPELEARLASSLAPDFRGEIAFCLTDDDQSAVLEIKDGSISVWDWTPGDIRVDLDQATTLKLVLGLSSFNECAQVQTGDDPRIPGEVCNALFPRQPTASGPWG